MTNPLPKSTGECERHMLTDHDLGALMRAQHADPFSILGPHMDADGVRICALFPAAHMVQAMDRDTGEVIGELLRHSGTDVFTLELPGATSIPDYRLEVHWQAPEAPISLLEDPYRFPVVLQDMDLWLLAEGTHLRPYECLGAHPTQMCGIDGTSFAVWAPNAKRVSVVGSFNGWDGRRHPMRLRRECGVWEIFLPHVSKGDLYKFEIWNARDAITTKADPFAFSAQLRPDTASVVSGLLPRLPMSNDRICANGMHQPLSIYEVHLGSWRKADGWRWLSYRELADTLVPYARELGFTHLELLPISEHPFDGSWGYQPLGLFAPTSRFGTPEDFKYFVDAAHAAGLGVILDWVPAHFPSDAHGLAEFDGTHLYEYADPKEGFHQEWNTLIYNFGRT